MDFLKVSSFIAKVMLAFFIGMVAGTTYKAFAYDRDQLSYLTAAVHIDKYINNNTYTLGAIILQESSAGKELRGDGGFSMGLGHVSVRAAIDAIDACQSKYKDLCGFIKPFDGDKEHLAIKLAVDHQYNLFMAAVYFKIHYDYYVSRGYSVPYTRALYDYNAGPRKAARLPTDQVLSSKYPNYVKQRIKNMRGYNTKYPVWG